MSEQEHTCGECASLIREDGEPYYCAIRDLYTLREDTDLACDDWTECDSDAGK